MVFYNFANMLPLYRRMHFTRAQVNKIFLMTSMYLKVLLNIPVSVIEYYALSPWYDKTCLTSMFHARASPFGEKMDPSIKENGGLALTMN
jgi:hypothetical protein